jgi:butyrate kinase
MTLTEKVDAILITGAMANSKTLVDMIVKRISKIGDIHIYPGDDDLDALAWNGTMMLKGELESKVY